MTIHWDSMTLLVVSQLWQVTVVALFVAVVVRLCCRQRPHLAYQLWMLVLIKCLTPPIWSSPVGLFSWAQVQVEVYDEPSDRLEPIVTETVVLTDTSPLVETASGGEDIQSSDRQPSREEPTIAAIQSETNTIASRPLSWPAIAVRIWIFGSVAMLLTVISRLFACVLIVRRSATVYDEEVTNVLSRLAGQLDIRRRVRLLVTTRHVGPTVFGLWRPTILLPKS